jgi:ribosomal protein S18 acetylase RimI-like enzyme
MPPIVTDKPLPLRRALRHAAPVDLPDGWTTRPATRDDAADCCDLVCAVDFEEYGEPDYEIADVYEDWSHDRFDLSRDTWLIHEPGGRLVGYALAWDKRPHELVLADLGVRPDAPDLYPWLVAAISQRANEHAAESGRTVAHVFSSEPNLRRAAALQTAGYQVVRVFRRMVIDLPGAALPAPEPPAGVAVRPVTEQDLPACWALHRESFAEHFDYAPEEYEHWRARLVETETYRPQYWWLAEVDGVPAGLLIGQRHEENGWVKTLGTLPAARGRGAGTALLLTALHAFQDDGCPRAGLGVDSANTTGAMALYERLGMRAEQRYDCYERVFIRS